MIIHSGGAEGTDKLFKLICDQYSIEYRGYYYGERSKWNAPYGNTLISQEDYKEGRVMATLAAKYNYGYNFDSLIKDPRLCRNWAQVKYSDVIIAIGEVVNVGEKLFNDNRVAVNPCVKGGTGYAVTMAIIIKKPVYVWHKSLKHWCTFNYKTNEWEFCAQPQLPNNFAGIGSREIDQQDIEAIIKFFKQGKQHD